MEKIIKTVYLEEAIHSRSEISNVNSDIKKKKIGKPSAIYVQNNSCLEKLDDVKIVWSNFRNCYKLIQNEDEVFINEEKWKRINLHLW